ncbi:MAG: nitroreductase [Actinomycetota bacterium]|nr:nitroreductase [Actinomycetota bacterium]
MTPADFAALVRSRRTNMKVDRDRPVPRELVEQLCELAQWAPNHKRTWPWRFAFAEGDGRARLGETISAAMEAHGDEPAKVAKALTKYLRTPASLIVGAAEGDSPLRTAENRDAVAAGVQTLLLGATAHGLATYWGSCPKGANDAVATLAGFEPGTTVVAIIYLGWPVEPAAVPERPAVALRTV